MPFQIIRGNILDSSCDAIINPSDEQLSGEGGLDREIHRLGGSWLDMSCRELAPICPGRAVVTESFQNRWRYIIHTAAPWYIGEAEQFEQLRMCYRNSFAAAERMRLNSVAFPLVGTGFRGFPKDLVLKIATEEARAFLKRNEDVQLTLVVHDMSQYQADPSLLADFEEHCHRRQCLEEARFVDMCCCFADLDDDEAAPVNYSSRPKPIAAPKKESKPLFTPEKGFKPDESFSQMVLRKIDEKGMTDPQCYHKANMDRRLFSKIRSQPDYQPKKSTALALAVALELDIEECKELLEKAGYSLSKSILFDQIIEYCICSKVYDVFVINELLFQYDQSLLG
ncbi:MAG: macro domain-containing protein [Oscillospiraceae bacterium]|nr:macro domain-containing protein [Oscillospiraceae bacterium]